MCGIAGVLRFDGDPAPVDRVGAMTALLAHRGPDGQGVADLGPLALGHRRLAVIDLSERAAQPMRLDEAGLVLSYNGELYNHRELRAELEEDGAAFRSDSDTEVVLQAYARWGEAAFERFNGMWALALWEERARRLVLSRDRLGIKPLYLRESPGELAFASELKALTPAEGWQVDDGVLGRFLLGGVQDDGARTFFRGARQLLPGRVAAWTLVPGQDPKRAERAFWSLDRAVAASADGPPASAPEAARALREALEASVDLRLRSDVPVGTCLSGGLDSSSIVALASRAGAAPVRTFTAVCGDPGHDEGDHARAVAARWGCQATEVDVSPGRELVELLDTIAWYHDEPWGRPGLVTQWSVMAAAQGEVTVLLDGQGGDELLLGYAGDALTYLRSLGRRVLRQGHGGLKLLRDAKGLLGLPTTSPDGAGPLWRHVARAGAARGRALGARRGPQVTDELRRAAAAVDGARAGGGSAIDRRLREEVARSSLPALLHHEDRASMAFGLEARVPFLDHRLVELALRLDFTLKVDGGRTKAVLRDAVQDLLPASVVERKDKLGTPAPLRRWLKGAEPAVREVLLDGFAERGLVDGVEPAWRAVERGRGDPWLAFRWLTTELWLRRFVDRPPAPPLTPPEARFPRPRRAGAGARAGTRG
jgi:asparagine synthase (glutamine-hydrolysing)